ncbi:MAG TPA: circadian clock protein KaiC [Candidatus Methanoperedenaceae archaeon]|nr:circadian clock protein KaiC [Candidatus Methanoperedenaceae archaeon]
MSDTHVHTDIYGINEYRSVNNAYETQVPTGIYGLDELIGGGFLKNTVNVVCGGTGTGKTTFGLQYALCGLNRGEKAVIISFEMSEKQIIKYANSLGWKEIENHVARGNLKIIQRFGEEMLIPPLEIQGLIRDEVGSVPDRIVLDPLTYIESFSASGRKSLSMIFQNLRETGTTVATLERPSDAWDGVPSYLADSVVLLENLGFGEMFDRTLRIIKTRGLGHGEGLYPYSIEGGAGIVVRASEKQKERVRLKNEYSIVFDAAMEEAEKLGLILLRERIAVLKDNWTKAEDPKLILDTLIESERKYVRKD